MFVLFAFYSKGTARINLYFVIPVVYLLHIFPFHFGNALKAALLPTSWQQESEKINQSIPLVSQFTTVQKILSTYCFASPVSPQGMLLFGAISSAYALR